MALPVRVSQFSELPSGKLSPYQLPRLETCAVPQIKFLSALTAIIPVRYREMVSKMGSDLPSSWQ
jgi:hypothetical protein